MIRFISLFATVCLWAVVALGQDRPPRAATNGEDADTAGIRKIEDDALTAERTTNAAVLERTMADDFVGIGPNGVAPGKAQLVKNWQAHAGQAPPYSVEISDMHIVVRGDVAAAAYTKTYTAKENGKVAHEDKTDVFTKDHGEWKLRVSRSSFR